MTGYTHIALCHDLRGEREHANRYTALGLRSFDQGTRAPLGAQDWACTRRLGASRLRGEGASTRHWALVPLVPRERDRRCGARGPLRDRRDARAVGRGSGDGGGGARGGQSRRAARSSPVRRPARGAGGRRRRRYRDGARLLDQSAQGFAALGAAWRRRGRASCWPSLSSAATPGAQSRSSPARSASSSGSDPYGRPSEPRPGRGDRALVRFELLGSLRVLDGGCDLTPARPKQRALLALLVLRRGEVVAGARLIEALWGEDPPGSAQNALHGHVSALRKLLGAERIRTRPPGYLLSAAADEVDVARFELLVGRARAHGGSR